MWSLSLLSCISVIVGLFFGYHTIARNRRPHPNEGATFVWQERHALWQQDRYLAVSVTLHGSGIVFLAVLFFLLVQHPQAKVFISWDVILSAMFVSWIAGSLIAFPFALRLAPAFRVSIFSNAVVRGQFIAEWSAFSHFRADPTTRLIRLFSARTPEVVRAIWQPPSPHLFGEVIMFLSHHIPTTMPTMALPWYRRRKTLIGALLFSTAILVVGGLVIYLWALGWARLYYPVAMIGLVASGGWLLQKFEVS